MKKSDSGAGTISVIVPVYNNEKVVQRCIDSVLGQTFADLELILVDDGSKDRSGALCDAAAAADPRVKVIHKENEGLMATWMRGVRESTGAYLAFVDADDWIEREMLLKMRACLAGGASSGETGGTSAQTSPSAGSAGQGRPANEGPPADGGGCPGCARRKREIICCSYRVDREWNGTSETKTHGAAPGVYEGEALRELKDSLLGHETRKIIASRCMKLFSRELIERNLYLCDPSIRMGEDLNITTPAILDAERIVIMEGAYYYHYIFYRDSMVHAYDPGLYDNMVRLRAKLLEILMAKRVPGALEMTEREYLFLLCIEMKNELRCTIGFSKDVVGRIQDICAAEHTGELVQFYPERIHDRANRLIVWMLGNPSKLRVRIVRRIFLAQQKRNQG